MADKLLSQLAQILQIEPLSAHLNLQQVVPDLLLEFQHLHSTCASAGAGQVSFRHLGMVKITFDLIMFLLLYCFLN